MPFRDFGFHIHVQAEFRGEKEIDMADLTRRDAIVNAAVMTLMATALHSRDAKAQPIGGANHAIRFNQPGASPLEALLIGNGRLGAMISGQPDAEIIPLNEDTLWSGQPYEWEMSDARPALEEVRRAVFASEYGAADRACQKIQGRYSHSYAPMANLRMSFDHDGPTQDYHRQLDLDEAVARVTYRVGEATYSREFFASAPGNLLYVKLSADRAGMLNLTLTLDSLLRYSVSADNEGVSLRGKAPTYCAPSYKDDPNPVVYSDLPGRGMAFATRLQILSNDGRIDARADRLHIRGASEIVFVVAAATGFKGFDQLPDMPVETVLAQAYAAANIAKTTPYSQALAAHLADHRSFYRRMSLLLSDAASEQTTDKRIASPPDAALAELYFNFSRYLLIASSRQDTQAANLQGIWSWEVRPPWSANYTTNINIQQNYWGAEVCNLSDLHQPMLDFVSQVAQTGRETARRLYGLDGWCVHHNSDLWRLSTPVGEGTGGPNWANFTLAGPWLARHVWEHYLFTKDAVFLEKTAYPLLRDCAAFCEGWLVRDPRNDQLTTAPSVSTENTFRGPDGETHAVSAGCTLDVALIRELFGFTIDAATALGRDKPYTQHLGRLLEQMPAYRIGRFGQLQEWEFDFEEPEPGQRHISHLYTVAPGWQITPRKTPDLARAASLSMQRRLAAGGDGTGWGRAWAVHVFARLGDGERALENLNLLLSGSTSPALLDVLPGGAGPLFQIDGNFSGGAAIMEMLLQSHDGAIAFLPALPSTWSKGAVQGARARGAVTVDMAWDQGRLATARLTPAFDGALRVRFPPQQRLVSIRSGSRRVRTTQEAGDFTFSAYANQVYELSFA